MKLRTASLACVLALSCSRAPVPPSPSTSHSTSVVTSAQPRASASQDEAPARGAAESPSTALPRVKGEGIQGFELSGDIVALAAAKAPSDGFPLGTVMLAWLAPTARLAEVDIASGRIVRTAPWPDTLHTDEASFGLAQSGDGWVTVTAGGDRFDEPTRVTRIADDLTTRQWSRTLDAGVYPAISADGETVAVSEQRPKRVELSSLDARTGVVQASRSYAAPALVLPRLGPLADVVLANGAVYVSLPTPNGSKVVSLTRHLKPRGSVAHPTNQALAMAGETPRLAATGNGLLVAHIEEGIVVELDPALHEHQRWTVALRRGDAVAAAPSGFVSAFGEGPNARRFAFERPNSWHGSDEGVFEHRLVANVHGRIVLATACCGHAALLVADR